MAGKKQSTAQNFRREMERKRKSLDSRGVASFATQSVRLSSQLEEAEELIDRRKFAEAEELLDQLDDGHRPAVLLAKILLFQTTNDHESCCQAARHLMALRPQEPEGILFFAQESMFCIRPTIARNYYRKFLQQFPNRPEASKVAKALELASEEVERRLEVSVFPKDRAEELLVLHEESLQELNAGKYSLCVEKCQELLTKAPSFVSARNNLAVAYFQTGSWNAAIDVVEDTLGLEPNNRFAQATLAKLYFLTGRFVDAQLLADQIMLDPPEAADPFNAWLETLALLGRDEQLKSLAESLIASEGLSRHQDAMRLHFLAYSQCRLGNEKAAKESWRKCLELFASFTDAIGNVTDLVSGQGHAPWSSSLGKWIPNKVMSDFTKAMQADDYSLSKFPEIASQIPALLDRGDPLGREFALTVAMADASPASLDALKLFALGSRGPDEMRSKALRFLTQEGVLDSGPQRFYCRGKWTNIKQFTAEIFFESEESNKSPMVDQLVSDGTEAMFEQDYDRAESCFQKAIAEFPDDCSAVYNLCVIWMRRDGHKGLKRARARLEQLHLDFPDYGFATIALAQMAVIDRNFDKARELMDIACQSKRMHITEAISLSTAQIQLALALKDFDSAENLFSTLKTIAGDYHQTLNDIRRMMEHASRWRR